jgi:hypothetical protein
VWLPSGGRCRLANATLRYRAVNKIPLVTDVAYRIPRNLRQNQAFGPQRDLGKTPRDRSRNPLTSIKDWCQPEQLEHCKGKRHQSRRHTQITCEKGCYRLLTSAGWKHDGSLCRRLRRELALDRRSNVIHACWRFRRRSEGRRVGAYLNRDGTVGGSFCQSPDNDSVIGEAARRNAMRHPARLKSKS